jgi:hypothetical protein
MAENDKVFRTFIEKSDHFVGIMLLTILNSQFKKKNERIKTHHGYYMASGIDVLNIIVDILDHKSYFEKNYNGQQITACIEEATMKILQCLAKNIVSLDTIIDSEKIKKIFKVISIYTNEKLLDILKEDKLEVEGHVKKTDITTYKFTSSDVLEKYKKLKRIDDKELLPYIERKYGSLCKCAFVIGWVLGLGDEKLLPIIEEIGNCFGIMLKITNDIVNLEQDIKFASEYTTNYIVNNGVYEGFSLFMKNKIKFIQLMMKYHAISDTSSEIIDLLESRIDECLEKVNIDLKSYYSSFNSAM